MKRFVFIMIAVAVVATLSLVIDAQSRKPLAIGSAGQAASLQTAIYAPGRIEGAAREAGVYPQTAGRVVEVAVAEGAWVEAGDVLFRLDNEQQVQQVRLAQAELALAEGELIRLTNGARDFERNEAAALHESKCAELEQAQLTLKRIQSLGQSAVASQELDNQRTRVAALTAEVAAARAHWELLNAPPREDDLEIARARVGAAQARLAAAQVQHDRTKVTAPAAGQVLDVEIEPGEHVEPLMAEAPIVMADTRRLRIRAFIEELDAPRVALGMRAEASADGLPAPLKGQVSQISPRMTAKELWSDRPNERLDTKSREVWIDLEGADDLVIGLRMDVMIRPDTAAEAGPESVEGTRSPQLSASPADATQNRH
jgi:HlyD family secretion protein